MEKLQFHQKLHSYSINNPKEWFIDDWNQPQLLSLILVVLICLILSLVVYFKAKKQAANKAPKGILFIMEGYINFIDGNYQESTEGKLKHGNIYILGLATLLLIGNIIALFGFEAIATSYSVTFTLALITWLGIYVVGLIYQKLSFFKRYINPIESIGQFAPLISLSFRIFGNIIGGSAIVLLVYLAAGQIWVYAFPNTDEWYIFAPIITPFLHMYFDIFGSVVQTLVFSILTTVYWAKEAEVSKKKKKKNQEPDVKVLEVKKNIY